MKSFSWAIVLALTILVGASEIGGPQASPAVSVKPDGESTAQQPTSRMALLIGINEYQDPAMQTLSGCLNDVEAMNSVLMERFGFAADDIVVLVDSEATRERILQEFERLILTAGSETTVVVHFSGHGSAVRDLDGDEPDGFDETLVPYDSGRGRNENRDITDDELNVFLGKLSLKTEKITLILDAAAGGATRTRSSGLVRAAPADYRERSREGWRPESDFFSDSDLALRGVTFVSASGQGFSVLEGSFGNSSDPVDAGVFSYFLTRRLWEADAEATWRDVFSRVAADVSAWGAQYPSFTGDIDKLVFSTPSGARQAYFLVDPVSRGVIVNGGALLGLSAGSILDVFPRNTEDFAVAPIARVRLKSVNFTTSLGEIVTGVVDEPSWAILSEVRYEKSKVRVRLDLVGNSKLTDELHDRLQASELIELVEVEYDLLVRETQGELHVEGPSASSWRSVIDLESDKEAIAAVLRHVDRRARWLLLLELQNPNPAFEVKLDVSSGNIRPGHRSGAILLREGDSFTVRVTNLHTEPVYPVMIVLSAYSEAQLLYPSSLEIEAIEPAEVIELELQATVETGLSEAKDVIKVIASTEAIGFLDLSSGAARGVTADNSVAQLFDYRARGSLGETRVDPRNWTVASTYLEVLPLTGGLILWVDDRPENNRLVRDRFRRQGWHSVLARSTAEALDQLKRQSFDVVISDFSRSEDNQDGYVLLNELKKRDESPPLIYFVANFTEEQAAEARQRGALGETNNVQELLKLVTQVRRGN